MSARPVLHLNNGDKSSPESIRESDVPRQEPAPTKSIETVCLADVVLKPPTEGAIPAPAEPAKPPKPATAPISTPPKEKSPDVDLVGPDGNFLAWAQRRKFQVQFTFNDGTSTTGVVTARGKYSIQLRGDRVIWKHSLREMIAVPVEEDAT
jgi:hypothetical protein